jgi:hypothetical protein
MSQVPPVQCLLLSDRCLRFVEQRSRRLSGNGDLDLNAGLDVNDDGLDGLGGGVQVDETLVNAELEGVPGLRTLTARSLTGGDLEVLGRQADGALDGEALAAGTLNELGADLLEGLNLAGGEGDADAVALGSLADVLVSLLVRHFEFVFGGVWVIRQDSAVGWAATVT